MPKPTTYCIFALFLYLYAVGIQAPIIKGPFRLLTENLTVTSNPQWLEVHAITHTDREPEEVDISIKVIRNFEQPIYIRGQISLVRQGERIMFIHGKWYEFCRFMENPKQDMFLAIYFRMQNDYGNQLKKCPIQKTEFNITGMQLKTSYFPSFIPAGRYTLTLTYAIKEEPKQVYQPICDYVWLGQIVR